MKTKHKLSTYPTLFLQVWDELKSTYMCSREIIAIGNSRLAERDRWHSRESFESLSDFSFSLTEDAVPVDERTTFVLRDDDRSGGLAWFPVELWVVVTPELARSTVETVEGQDYHTYMNTP